MPRLKQAVQDKSLPNVRFLGRYPQQAMPSLYALADVLFVHLKNEPLFEITIPIRFSRILALASQFSPQ